MTIPEELNKVIVSNPEILGGTPCFTGTRVPLWTYIDHLETGISLDDFLRRYSSVTREQAEVVLEWFGAIARHAAGLDAAS